MNRLEKLKENQLTFFEFMSAKYPVKYHSNIFLRDLQYAIFLYFKYAEDEINISEAEELALSFAAYLVEKGDLKVINDHTWFVDFEVESQPEVVEEEAGKE